jgi:SAM-dependent methyltransferase
VKRSEGDVFVPNMARRNRLLNVTDVYTKDFYEGQQSGSRRSAERIIPLVLELLRPNSVVDVGCGVGTWLAVFAERGVPNILGVDGEYVDRRLLQIPQDRFYSHDLTKPLRLNQRFELVLCLEVAEHLDMVHVPVLIDSLARLGPVVLFSAAIPYQGGIHHVNEQWPEYWAYRFLERGYVPVDSIRHKVWADPNVEWWYAQNMMFFVERDYMKTNETLSKDNGNGTSVLLSLVHPQKYMETVLLLRLAREGAAIVPPQVPFILVDDAQFGVEAIPGRTGLPFLERDGVWWGRPVDDAEAVSELERLRRSGSGFLIFTWVSFWWLDYYTGFHRYLRSRFRCAQEDDCLIAFDLTKGIE